jgi:hypothetical protein
LNLDTSNFDRQAAVVQNKVKDIGNKISGIGDKVARTGEKLTLGLTLPILAGAAFAVKGASDMVESLNKVDVAFKDSAEEVKNWSKTTLKNIGLAKGSALDAAALFGDMGTSMGLNTKEAAKMSMSLVNLAGDLASFKNIGIDQATTALAGIFTGETESLKRLGIVMTDTNVKAYAMKNGFTGVWEEADQSTKVIWRYKYVMEQTKNAQGDFARTSTSTANQIRYTKERVKELSAEFGERLLPITGRILDKMNELLDKFEGLSDSQKDLIIQIGLFAAAVGPALMIVGKLTSSIGNLIQFLPDLGPLLANPYFWIALGVLLLIAGAVYLIYRNWSTLKDFFQPVIDKLKQLWDISKPFRDFVVNEFKKALDDLKKAFDELVKSTGLTKQDLQNLAFLMTAFVIGPVILIVGAILAIVYAIIKVVTWLIQFQNWINNTAQAFKDWVAKTYNLVVSTINNIGAWFAGLPGRIASALGNMGSLLYNAGKSVLEGFWNGLIAKWNQVAAWVSSLKGRIQNLKGPLDEDKVLLVKQGDVIMQGLNKGMIKGFTTVEDTLSGFNTQIGNFNPTIAATPNVATQTTSVNNNIYGNISLGDKSAVDRFFDRLNRNGELSAKGMATL